MKKLLMLATLAIIPFLFSSCNRQALPSFTLSTDGTQVSFNATRLNDVAFNLSWESTGGNVEVNTIYVQFAANKEFLNPYVLKSTGNSFVVTNRDLKKMQDEFGVKEDYQLQVRLLVEGEDVPSTYSNRVKIDVAWN